MLHFGDVLVDSILIPFLLAVFNFFGVVGIVLGLGLLFRTPQTLGFLHTLNRWTSVRTTLKPMEEPREFDWVVYRHRHVFGAVFAAAGIFVIFMLLAKMQFASLYMALSDNARSGVIEAIVDAVRWFLVAGGLLAVAVGISLIASSKLVPAMGARLNKWYSPRRLNKGEDKMYMTLDDWAAAHPRTMGGLLIAGSAIALVTATIVWIGN
jgi:hypothetical protein